MKKTWIVGCSMAAFAAMANVKPANVFSSNMVLQRDKVVPVWGTADVGEEVKVSFAGQSVAAKADADDLAYLKRALGTLPSVSGIAGYDRNVVADYQLVPFLRGLERVRPRAQLEIHSKVGQAYGFLIDNAYVVDKKTGRGFFLAAAVYANPDEVMNDDAYAYDSVAFPVLADVAEAVARWVFETP